MSIAIIAVSVIIATVIMMIKKSKCIISIYNNDKINTYNSRSRNKGFSLNIPFVLQTLKMFSSSLCD